MKHFKIINALLISALLCFTSMTDAKKLTLKRIFESPDLSGTSLRNLKISPDGSRVTFLQGKQEDKDQYDLWEYNIADNSTRLLVDSKALLPEGENLSAEEKARRERQRLAGLKGIIEYYWSNNGQTLLFPLGGNLYQYKLNVPSDQAVKQLTDSDAFDTDARFSPQGSYVSFIREQNIYVVDTETGKTRQMTQDGKDLIKNGMAEFVAQEEMDRDTGYWWSPDEKHIAYLQVDESPVSITERYEINADNIEIIKQRYPYTGEANVDVKLGILNMKKRSTRWVDTGEETDFYIPRVNWLPDSKKVSYQWQSRDQQTLELRFANLSGDSKTILTDRSETWINLHHDLRFLADESFIWASERDGFKHLYHFDDSGKLLKQLTKGNWMVDEITGINKDTGHIFFTGTYDSPLEKQLYSQKLDTDTPEKPQRITQREGFHSISMDKEATVYIDRWNDREHPTQISLHKTNGERVTWLNENRLDENHPYHAYLDEHIKNEFGELKAADGQTLHYRMIKPADFSADKKYPVFFYTYGGPHAQLVTKAWPRRFVEQYMAQQGFLVFVLDNRGMARRGVRFEAPLYKKMGGVEIVDQLVGVDYLKTLPYVDGDRIGIFGWSYGGYMALRALSKAPDTFAIGVSVAPVSDFRLYDTHYTERYMSTPQLNAEGYEETAIFGDADKIQDHKLLLIHGMADDNVLFTNTTKMIKLLQDAGILFDTMIYPGAKHGISGSTAQYHVYKTISDFYIKHLKP
ncbi:DPP IV N-terminal domain-containing protein [Marinicella sp. W31]|uniref:S9 family peptidase n=1 Tax=Marinicella sp. W31 TaxID=3023713 RepID=UPI003757C08F